jgi:glutamine amidotransferase
MRHVTLIDYGMGNLCSVQSALEYVGATVTLTDNVEQVAQADTLVLPGVGSFRMAMQTLRERGMDGAIKSAVSAGGAKILGICLGMQLLGSHSTEHGETDGLALVPNVVERFKFGQENNLKIPHVGFNSVNLSEAKGLFEGLPQYCDFYFVHSYRMLPEPQGQPDRIGLCDYGESFLAAFENENICGTQFHPEKSQTNGLRLLKNFIR